jgi:hypothetical protein
LNLLIGQHGHTMCFASGSHPVAFTVGRVIDGSSQGQMLDIDASDVAAGEMADLESLGNHAIMLNPDKPGDKIVNVPRLDRGPSTLSVVCSRPMDTAIGTGRAVVLDTISKCGTALPSTKLLGEVGFLQGSGKRDSAPFIGAGPAAERLTQTFVGGALMLRQNTFEFGSAGGAHKFESGISGRFSGSGTLPRAEMIGSSFSDRLGKFAGPSKKGLFTTGTDEVGHGLSVRPIGPTVKPTKTQGSPRPFLPDQARRHLRLRGVRLPDFPQPDPVSSLTGGR